MSLSFALVLSVSLLHQLSSPCVPENDIQLHVNLSWILITVSINI